MNHVKEFGLVPDGDLSCRALHLRLDQQHVSPSSIYVIGIVTSCVGKSYAHSTSRSTNLEPLNDFNQDAEIDP